MKNDISHNWSSLTERLFSKCMPYSWLFKTKPTLRQIMNIWSRGSKGMISSRRLLCRPRMTVQVLKSQDIDIFALFTMIMFNRHTIWCSKKSFKTVIHAWAASTDSTLTFNDKLMHGVVALWRYIVYHLYFLFCRNEQLKRWIQSPGSSKLDFSLAIVINCSRYVLVALIEGRLVIIIYFVRL